MTEGLLQSAIRKNVRQNVLRIEQFIEFQKKTFCRAFYQILFPKSGRHSDLLLLVFVDNSATRQSHFSVFCALDGPKI